MSDDNQTLGQRLADHVSKKATSLQQRYQNDERGAVAELAVLRRGVTKPLGSDATLVGLTVAGLYADPTKLPDTPQNAELAAYAALTLFAVHQQSHRNARMHQYGYSFGRSARLLGKQTNAAEAVRRRFTALATASSWDETMHHARSLVQQLRAHGIPLDYGQFARDLLSLQHLTSADRVRLTWGRDFYQVPRADDDNTPDDENDTGTTAPEGAHS